MRMSQEGATHTRMEIAKILQNRAFIIVIVDPDKQHVELLANDMKPVVAKAIFTKLANMPLTPEFPI